MHWQQGRSQTFSFRGATGGASFATRGAVNGPCRTFRKRPENFWGATGVARQNFGRAPPLIGSIGILRGFNVRGSRNSVCGCWSSCNQDIVLTSRHSQSQSAWWWCTWFSRCCGTVRCGSQHGRSVWCPLVLKCCAEGYVSVICAANELTIHTVPVWWKRIVTRRPIFHCLRTAETFHSIFVTSMEKNSGSQLTWICRGMFREFLEGRQTVKFLAWVTWPNINAVLSWWVSTRKDNSPFRNNLVRFHQWIVHLIWLALKSWLTFHFLFLQQRHATTLCYYLNRYNLFFGCLSYLSG